MLTVVALDAALGDELLVAGSTAASTASVVRAGRVVLLRVAIALLTWCDLVERVVLVLS